MSIADVVSTLNNLKKNTGCLKNQEKLFEGLWKCFFLVPKIYCPCIRLEVIFWILEDCLWVGRWKASSYPLN